MAIVLLVPRGAEAAAVRRARGAARIVALRAGRSAAGDLPAFAPGDAVLVLGVAGALRDHRVGDVVVYRSVADDAGRIALPERDALPASLRALTGAATAVDACTVDRVVVRRTERAALAQRFAASVVDMEGTHLARALHANNVPFAMVRAISDDASRDLPALEHAITADGGVDAMRIALAFVRAPRAAYAFVRDAQQALRALTAVTRRLDELTPLR